MNGGSGQRGSLSLGPISEILVQQNGGIITLPLQKSGGRLLMVLVVAVNVHTWVTSLLPIDVRDGLHLTDGSTSRQLTAHGRELLPFFL